MPHRSKIFRDLGAIFNSTYTETNPNNFILNKRFFSLANLKEIKNFAFSDLLSFFNNNDNSFYFINENNILLGNKIFYTFRNEQPIDDDSSSSEEVLNENFLRNENKKIIENNGNYFIWKRKTSFKESGGYLYEHQLTIIMKIINLVMIY